MRIYTSIITVAILLLPLSAWGNNDLIDLPPYVIAQEGETLQDIAKKHLQDEDAWVELKILNQILDQKHPKAGRKILLPGPKRNLAIQALKVIPGTLKHLEKALQRKILPSEQIDQLKLGQNLYRKAQDQLRQTQYQASIKTADESWKQLLQVRRFLKLKYQTSLSIQVTETGQSNIQVLQGSAEVRTKKGTEIIKQGEGLVVSKNGVSERKTLLPPPETLLPADGSEIFQDQVTFRWEKLAKADHYQLLISEDDDFKFILLKLDSKETRINFSEPLEDGTYYWTVKAIDKDGFKGLPSPVQYFKLAVDRESPAIRPDAIQWD